VKLTETQVRHVANLANLNLTDTEVVRMAQDLDSVLDHMDRLAGIDTEGVEPMAQVIYETDGTTAGNGTLRPDVERAPLDNEVALANAPMRGNGYFKVPKVIER
jgi:aspartyl-tRNA(Asn)/glutamyl-tRNA(Gln) amidotransferase subunit C